MRCVVCVLLLVLIACTPRRQDAPMSHVTEGELLADLLEQGKRSKSDALIVVRDAQVLCEWYAAGGREPIESMSITKSVVALAVGRLVDDGKLKLSIRVATLYPEWAQGRKQDVTVEHLMTHTSGLQVSDAEEATQRYPDYVQRALAAELSNAPGEAFVYNNKAVNLLAGVVERVSGLKVDDFVRQEFFVPLGIASATWKRDAAGNPLVTHGLAISPPDLVKVGQMLLDGGVVSGKRLLSADWIERMTRPSQTLNVDYGLLWWLSRGASPRSASYAAMGSLGQYLVVVPEAKIVAVRMRRATALEWPLLQWTNGRWPAGLNFEAFPTLVTALPSQDN